MRKFIRNILLVLIPAILFVVYLLTIFANQKLHWFYIGHSFNKNFILGEPYNDAFLAYYKLHKNAADYKILAIGSSRVMQFSEDMFGEKFFNLGYLSNTVYNTHNLIERLDLRNKLLIIGLDQWAFNSNWQYLNNKEYLKGNIYRPGVLTNDLKIKDILRGKVYPRFGSECDIELIGSGAKMAITGIRPDGSYYYGKIYQGMLNNDKDMIGGDFGFAGTLERVKYGMQRFEFGEKADANALKATRDLIAMCKSRQNNIVLFFPPFPPAVHKEMNNSKYAYIADAATQLAKLCDSSGIAFYDFTSVPSSDADYVDGMHGGKKVYYDMLKQMQIAVLPLHFISSFETTSDSTYTRCRINFFNAPKR